MTVEPNLTLLQLLRERLGVTSPKRSCEQGECGACTVILDGKAVNSCLVLAVTVDGKRVETVESLAKGGELHPLQKAFVDIAAANAATARRGCCWRPRPCSMRTRSPPTKRSRKGCRATCAGAPGTSSLSKRCWPRPKRCAAAGSRG